MTALTIPDFFRDLDGSEVSDLAADESMARDAIRLMRWPPHGDPMCPRCNFDVSYFVSSRNLWKCKACDHQFTVTSGTWMASSKLRHSTILIIIWSFAKGEFGERASQLQKLLGCEYKTAMIWVRKLQASSTIDAPVARSWKGYWQRRLQ